MMPPKTDTPSTNSNSTPQTQSPLVNFCTNNSLAFNSLFPDIKSNLNQSNIQAGLSNFSVANYSLGNTPYQVPLNFFGNSSSSQVPLPGAINLYPLNTFTEKNNSVASSNIFTEKNNSGTTNHVPRNFFGAENNNLGTYNQVNTSSFPGINTNPFLPSNISRNPFEININQTSQNLPKSNYNNFSCSNNSITQASNNFAFAKTGNINNSGNNKQVLQNFAEILIPTNTNSGNNNPTSRVQNFFDPRIKNESKEQREFNSFSAFQKKLENNYSKYHVQDQSQSPIYTSSSILQPGNNNCTSYSQQANLTHLNNTNPFINSIIPTVVNLNNNLPSRPSLIQNQNSNSNTSSWCNNFVPNKTASNHLQNIPSYNQLSDRLDYYRSMNVERNRNLNIVPREVNSTPIVITSTTSNCNTITSIPITNPNAIPSSTTNPIAIPSSTTNQIQISIPQSTDIIPIPVANISFSSSFSSSSSACNTINIVNRDSPSTNISPVITYIPVPRKNYQIEKYDFKLDQNNIIPGYRFLYENLQCSICLHLLINPKACNKCSKVFCSTCITKWKTIKTECPFRCEGFAIVTINHPLSNILSRIKINCPLCEEVTAYDELTNHISSCKNSNYKCLGKKCTFIGDKIKMEEHVKNCYLVEENCEFCVKAVVRKNRNVHLQQDCTESIIKCAFCKVSMKRKNQVHHSKEECILTIIEIKDEEIRSLREQMANLLK